MRCRLIFVCLLLLSFLIPSVVSHAAPPEREYETRVLHDHNDDSVVVLQGKHGFDAIALDVREGGNPELGDYLVLRLSLNGGCKPTEPPVPDPSDPTDTPVFDPVAAQEPCGVLSETVQFIAGGQQYEVEFITADGGLNWTGNAAEYVGPESLNDGNRFAIEGWIPFAHLGLEPGAELTDWFVVGRWGEETTDNMPAGADNQRSVADPLEAAFDIGSYALRTPDYFVDVTADAVQLSLDSAALRATVTLEITNVLETPQTIQLALPNPTGVIMESLSPDLDLAAGASGIMKVRVTAVSDHDLSDDIIFYALTNLGGSNIITISVKFEALATPSSIVSPEIPPGETFSFRFITPGQFHYHQHHMDEVTGRIDIIEYDSDLPQFVSHDVVWELNDAGQFAFIPADLTINAGDTVVWHNNGNSDIQIMGTTGDEDHSAHVHPEDEGIPAPSLVFLAFGIVAIALFLRRK